jgi:hypothetical protein
VPAWPSAIVHCYAFLLRTIRFEDSVLQWTVLGLAVFLLFLLRKSRGEVSGKNSFSGFHPPAQRNAFRLDAASTIQIVRLYESTVAVLFTGEPNGDAVANSSIDTIASCFP